jgi:hypothetical protein
MTTSHSTSMSASVGTGHGTSRERGVLPLARGTSSRSVQATDSRTDGEAESVSEGLSLSTAWGQTTSVAAGTSESMAYAAQRSREFLVEQYELQRLPASAMILSYAGPAGREVVLADVNPGIGGLSSATMRTLDESRATPAELPEVTAAAPAGEPANRFGADPPNLGPPPPRLDWRRRYLAAGIPDSGGAPSRQADIHSV